MHKFTVLLCLVPTVALAQYSPGQQAPNFEFGTMSQISVSVGTASGALLAANKASNFLRVCIAAGAANGIWVRWDGGTAATAAPSELIAPGTCVAWYPYNGFLPTVAINAIASAAVNATVEYQ